MAEVASAFVSLMFSAKGSQGQITKELSGAGKSGGASAASGFKGSFLPAMKGLAGPIAGLFAISAVKDFFGSALDEARESQKVSAQTASVIKATGGAANVSAGQIGNLATKLSNMSGVDDEVIQSGANMLLTFKNVRNEAGKGNDIFDQSTKTLLDLSTAMGTEPKQAAIQLGKALNDPIKGITALTRVGVTFTEGQKKTITSLVKSGDVMGAQKIILKELNSEFGGSAKAQATAADKASVAWGNFKEAIGTALIPVLDKVLNFIAAMLPKILQLGGAVGSVLGPAFHGVGVVIKGIITGFAALGSAIEKHKTTFTVIAGIITALLLPALVRLGVQYALAGAKATASGVKQAAAWVVAKAQAIGAAAVYVAQSAIMVARWILMGAVAMAQAIRIAAAWLISIGPIGLIIAAVIGLVVVIVKNWDTIRNAITTAATAVLNFLKANWPLILAIITGPIGIAVLLIIRHWDQIKAATSAAWNAIKATLSAAWSFILGLVSSATGAVRSAISSAWSAVTSLTSSAWGRIRAAVSAGISAMLSLVRSIPGRVTGALGNLGSLLYNAGRNIIQGLVNGIKSMIGAVGDAVGSVMSRARDLLPFSPAKKGPFSGRGWTLYSGRSLVEGLIEGVESRSSALERAIGSTLVTPSLDELDKLAVASVARPHPPFAGGASSDVPAGGINVETLEVKAFSDRFSLKQVQDELSLHGAV